jgi:hypothetical protein
METKELNGYKIEFYSEDNFYNSHYYGRDNKNDVYIGEVVNITEELSEKIIGSISDYIEDRFCSCGERHTCYYCERMFNYSFQEFIYNELSNLPYCIITKIISS